MAGRLNLDYAFWSFWPERDVHWSGGKANEGAMLGIEKQPREKRGRPTKDEKDSEKNYRDFVGLYCLYGEGILLYIGEAGLETKQTLFDRLKQHRKGPMAGRWDKFSWFGRENCEGETPIKTSLAQLEAVSISIVNPGFNKQSGTFKGAKQVFQVPHKDADGDIETKLAYLTELLGGIKAKVG